VGVRREYADSVPLTASALLAVFAGGLLGSAARFAVELGVTGVVGDSWPYGVLVVNLVGSFVLGFVVGRGFPRWPEWLRVGATTGFLGSFTTLSAISLDVAVPILRNGVSGFAFMAPYAIGSIVVGVVVAWWGLRLGLSRAGDAT